jgi:hypothetical protein
MTFEDDKSAWVIDTVVTKAVKQLRELPALL